MTERLLEFRRPLGGDATHFVRQVHRHRREDVVPCAVRKQHLHHVTMRVVVAAVPARRPADHLERVVVAVADDVAAGVDQALDDIGASGGRGPVHGVGVVALLARVDVEAAPQQQIDDREPAFLRRGMQPGPLVRLAAHLQRLGMRVEQRRERRRGRRPRSPGAAGLRALFASTCALSARQLLKPYSLARANWASLSCASGSVARNSSRRAFACLRSQSRSGFSGSCFGASVITHLLSFERAGPFRAARCPQVGRGTKVESENLRAG